MKIHKTENVNRKMKYTKKAPTEILKLKMQLKLKIHQRA